MTVEEQLATLERTARDLQSEYEETLSAYESEVASIEAESRQDLVDVDNLAVYKNQKLAVVSETFEKQKNASIARYESTLSQLRKWQKRASERLDGMAIKSIGGLTSELREVVSEFQPRLSEQVDREASLHERLIGLGKAEKTAERELEDNLRKADRDLALSAEKAVKIEKVIKRRLRGVQSAMAPIANWTHRGSTSAVNVGTVVDGLQQIRRTWAAAYRLYCRASELHSEWRVLRRRSRLRALLVLIALLFAAFVAYHMQEIGQFLKHW